MPTYGSVMHSQTRSCSKWKLIWGRVNRICGPACAPIRAGSRNCDLIVLSVIFVRDILPITQVIDDLLAIVGASKPDDWKDRTDFLPL